MVKGHDSPCTKLAITLLHRPTQEHCKELMSAGQSRPLGKSWPCPQTQPSTHLWVHGNSDQDLASVAAVPHHPSLCYISFSGWWRFDAPSLTTESGCHLFLQAKTPILSCFTRACPAHSHLCLALGVAAGRPSGPEAVVVVEDHITIHLLHLHPAQVHLASELWEPVLEALALLGTTSKMSPWGGWS